jgi:hypothetical protein
MKQPITKNVILDILSYQYKVALTTKNKNVQEKILELITDEMYKQMYTLRQSKYWFRNKLLK